MIDAFVIVIAFIILILISIASVIAIHRIMAVYYLEIINSHMDSVIKMVEDLIEETVKKDKHQ